MHGAADGTVGAAAADVGEDLVDIAVGRIGPGLEQGCRSHDEPGLAVAALRHLLLDPGLLDGVQPAGRETLDRHHRAAMGLADRHRAGADRYAVDVHGAGAAGRYATTKLRADEPQVLAQDPKQR